MWSDEVLVQAQEQTSRLRQALAMDACAPTQELINSIVLALSNDLDTSLIISELNTWSLATLSRSEGGNSLALKIALDALLGIEL
jgi:L-cysteine:1D-myo-inositol 2-amino-2-deoxy-alpha-D-glucopyranoside ligase